VAKNIGRKGDGIRTGSGWSALISSQRYLTIQARAGSSPPLSPFSPLSPSGSGLVLEIQKKEGAKLIRDKARGKGTRKKEGKDSGAGYIGHISLLFLFCYSLFCLLEIWPNITLSFPALYSPLRFGRRFFLDLCRLAPNKPQREESGEYRKGKYISFFSLCLTGFLTGVFCVVFQKTREEPADYPWERAGILSSCNISCSIFSPPVFADARIMEGNMSLISEVYRIPSVSLLFSFPILVFSSFYLFVFVM